MTVLDLTTTHDVEIRDTNGQTVATGQVRLFNPGKHPEAFPFGHGIAIATGEMIGTTKGPIRWIYRVTQSAAFIPDARVI